MRRLIIGIGAVIVSTTMMSHAQSPDTLAVTDNETSQLWFVELSSPPGIEGTTVAALDREEASFHQAASGAGIRYAESRHYRDLFNGLTVRANGSAVNKLRALPGVQAVYPVVKVSVAQEQLDVATEQPPPIEADLITAVKQTGVDIAQSELGLTGRGVKVAVIDTGIDYQHPDLGGCFGPGCRVAKGYDLVGDAFNAQDASPIIAPDRDPDDCAGHGTHVAGIIGAKGGLTGVAPGVTFFAYRVFGCVGSTTADIMLDAMERARRDGADVVNMSIGAAFQWPQYPTAKAADRLVHHGIVVVASAGNDGALGLYASSAPSVGKDVIAVASFDNTHQNVTAFTISPDNAPVGYIGADGSPAAPTTGSFPMARTGTSTSTADACAALPAGSLTGMVALIRRGTCAFYVKAFNAQTAGAVGVVIYNNVAGLINATVAGTPPITIPVVTIKSADGVLINNRLASGAVTMTWTSQVVSEPNPTGNLISGFSSYGPAPELSFKPDLGAPGGLIRSTLPLEQGGYGVLSGTSMSSPHVAGAAALLLEAKPHASPQDVQVRMQNTARPQLWSGNPTLGLIDIVHRQGAGMLRIDDAIETDVTVSPSSLALGEFETAAAVQRSLRLEIETPRHHHHHDEHGDDDDTPVTYTLSHVPGVTTGPNTFTLSFFAGFATVTFSAPTVTIGGHDGHGHGHGHDDDDAVVDVTIAPPPAALPDRSVFGGYIVLTPDDGSPVLRVPYTGFKGDYQAIQVVTPTAAGFPWLAQAESDGFLHNRPAGATFTMQGDDVPFFIAHLDHQSRNLKMEVIEVATGKSFNFADDEDYLGRNSQATSAFVFAWDGTTFRRPAGKLKTVPNGTYRIELSVLKALGDPNNPAHTEHWSSPNITIARQATP